MKKIIDIIDIIKSKGFFNSIYLDEDRKYLLSLCQKESFKSAEIYTINISNFSIELCIARQKNKSYEAISVSQCTDNANINMHITDNLGIMNTPLNQFFQLQGSSLPTFSVCSKDDIEQIELHFTNVCKLIYENKKSVPNILFNFLFTNNG